VGRPKPDELLRNTAEKGVGDAAKIRTVEEGV
jgi:hypothetical protein